jgi:hypothetical protein
MTWSCPIGEEGTAGVFKLNKGKSEHYYINFPFSAYQAMEFQPGEISQNFF